MVLRRSQHTSCNIISHTPSVIALLERIQQSHVLCEQKEKLYHLKYKCIFLLLLIPILCFLKCHTRIYNAWVGPFHLNLDSFIEHWKIYSGDLEIERSFLVGLFSFDKEYLQIELGENQINNDTYNMYFVYFRHPMYNQLLYTFDPIKESSITNLSKKLFVKLPTYLTSHFHKRHPYRFEQFNSNTLKCIIRQLDISSEVDNIKLMKSMHIKIIEEIYDQNATEFNMKVINQCGILLGYLYDCQNEIVFSPSSNQRYKFSDFVAAFDASSSYSPYMRNYLERIPYPIVVNRNTYYELEWLHQRLMYYSAKYRYSYELEQLRQRQEAIRTREEQRRYRLALFIEEEERIQRLNQEVDFEQIWNRVPSASPRFIANFRLEDPKIVNSQLCETNCSICLETLQPDEHYSQWPCPAQHVFHYNCMLNVLRRQNSCPLCRHLVEAAPLPSLDVVWRNFLFRVASRVAN
ncbi:unnamed protein product [Rotaria sordida]|uniref:RING-type domain-containing protein n=1 Tax=Rotaria sordida TaxID=392033 RepID=A0A814LT53_9BILA|nr:unnamed protein product [Rotaria sordida]CAF3790432.1 unnamed protein product [Rotaria sordida]